MIAFVDASLAGDVIGTILRLRRRGEITDVAAQALFAAVWEQWFAMGRFADAVRLADELPHRLP